MATATPKSPEAERREAGQHALCMFRAPITRDTRQQTNPFRLLDYRARIAVYNAWQDITASTIRY